MNKKLLALIYGAPGTGKSTLAADAPGPKVILDTEGASAFYEGDNVFVTEPEDVSDFKGATHETNFIIPHLHPASPGASIFAEIVNRAVHYGGIRSVVVDSLTQWQSSVIEQEQARQRRSGWDTAKAINTRTDRMVTFLRNSTMPFVALAEPTAHEHPLHVFLLCSERRISDPENSDPERVEAALQGKSLITTGAHCDLIGHLTAEGKEGDRYLYITATERRSCKSRAPALIAEFGERIPIRNPFREGAGIGLPEIVEVFEEATRQKGTNDE